jgi:hypothetical protein
VLYGFIIVRLDRRELVWIAVTNSPTADWIARQITEAFPWDCAPAYLIRDRDGAFGSIVKQRFHAMGIRDRPIAPHSPWQNGYAERLNRQIRTARDVAHEGDGFADRKLSFFRENLNEWLRRHVNGEDCERRRAEIRDEAKALQKYRNDLAHNISAVNPGQPELKILIVQEEPQAPGQSTLEIRKEFISESELIEVIQRCEALYLKLMFTMAKHYETHYPRR